MTLVRFWADHYFFADVQCVLVNIEYVCLVYENFTAMVADNIACWKTQHLLRCRIGVSDCIPHIQDKNWIAHAVDNGFECVWRELKKMVFVDLDEGER